MATKNTEPKSVLGIWLWRKPLKFAILTLFALFITSMIWGLVTYNIYGDTNIVPMQPLFIILTIIMTLGIIWLIWRLPKDNLDRTSFVALRTGASVISFVVSIISVFILADVLRSMFITTSISGTFSTGTMIALAVVLITAMYIFGLYVSGVYATFLRMRKMGVATWKLICALPFGYAMLWPAGYVTGDTRDIKTPVISPRTTWYKNFVTRITSHPYNTILMATVLMLMGALITGLLSPTTAISVSGFILFGFWFAISGATKMRTKIPGIFATIAIIFNIVAIIASLTIQAPIPQSPIPTQSDIEITVTETIKSQQ